MTAYNVQGLRIVGGPGLGQFQTMGCTGETRPGGFTCFNFGPCSKLCSKAGFNFVPIQKNCKCRYMSSALTLRVRRFGK